MSPSRAPSPDQPLAGVAPAVLLVRADGLILGATDEAKALLGIEHMAGLRLQDCVTDHPSRVLELIAGDDPDATPYGAVLTSLVFRRQAGSLLRCIVRVSKGIGMGSDGSVWRRMEIRAPATAEDRR